MRKHRRAINFMVLWLPRNQSQLRFLSRAIASNTTPAGLFHGQLNRATRRPSHKRVQREDEKSTEGKKKKKKKNLHLYSPLLELGVENAIGNKLALLRDRGGHSAFGEKQEEKGEDGDGNDFFFQEELLDKITRTMPSPPRSPRAGKMGHSQALSLTFHQRAHFLPPAQTGLAGNEPK